ncbi:type II toxin-antitoxin system VapC family toxin [Leptolyngbyaceae cyanobacterium UHCC 1019]
MNHSLMVLDTNIALYYLGGRLTDPLPDGLYHVSIITEMELLSYPNLSQAEEQQICSFLAQLLIVAIDEPIKKMAIDLRKQYRLKLPDAIISATAQSLKALLLTNDLKLSSIPILQTQSLPIK